MGQGTRGNNKIVVKPGQTSSPRNLKGNDNRPQSHVALYSTPIVHCLAYRSIRLVCAFFRALPKDAAGQALQPRAACSAFGFWGNKRGWHPLPLPYNRQQCGSNR